jgi:DNA-binding XRE family transcriptional regulator
MGNDHEKAPDHHLTFRRRAGRAAAERLRGSRGRAGGGQNRYALAVGREELLSAEEAAALLAAPVPLAFWRKRRGNTQSQLAADIYVSQNFLSDLERGKANGDVALYAKIARRLGVQIEDLVPDANEPE